MNIPSPAAVKKLTDERKAREAELASQLQSASQTKQLPSTQDPSSKRALKGTSVSDQSRSSQKVGGSQDRSSNSARSNKPSQKQRFAETKSRSNSESDTKVRTGTSKTYQNRKSSETNSPQTNSKTSSGSDQKAKKSFVRPEHLTTRPLRDNEALLGLKKSLERPARGQFKREYRSSGRQAGKSTQGQTVKKENN